MFAKCEKRKVYSGVFCVTFFAFCGPFFHFLNFAPESAFAQKVKGFRSLIFRSDRCWRDGAVKPQTPPILTRSKMEWRASRRSSITLVHDWGAPRETPFWWEGHRTVCFWGRGHCPTLWHEMSVRRSWFDWRANDEDSRIQMVFGTNWIILENAKAPND